MTGTREAILNALIYFEVFRHPLTSNELYELVSITIDRQTFENELEGLVAEALIGFDSGFYFLPDGQANIGDRIRKLERSRRYQRMALYISRLISMHPFVRGVMISGSMSKKALSEKDDIDFFVITQPGRLWICRTFLMLFKKVFLLNSKKYFCINYYIDTRSLEIPDRNLFTATELAFLLPVQNPGLYHQFLDANGWVRGYFPNRVFDTNGCPDTKDPWLKRAAEKLLKGRMGEQLDDYFMNIYRERSVRRYRNSDTTLFELNFRSGKNVSKHHPDGFQEKILHEYAELTARFEHDHGMKISLPSRP